MEVLHQVFGGFLNGVQGRYGAVRPHPQYQPFPVRLLADHHPFYGVFHLADGVVDGVHRQRAHRQPRVPDVARHNLLVALARFHIELNGQGHEGVVQRGQVQLRVDDAEIAGGGDVAGAHPALAHHIQPHLARTPGQRLDADALDAQEQIHHLLFDAGDDRIFVRHFLDFHPGHRRAPDGAEQQPPQRIAHGGGETAFQRLQRHAGVLFAALNDPDGRVGRLGFGLPQRRENRQVQHSVSTSSSTPR